MPIETFALPPPNLAVAVIGDVMIDDNFGLTNTVPLSDLGGQRSTLDTCTTALGGAGNVAANLSGLGLGTALVGMIGDDIHGGRLLSLAKTRCNLAQMLFVCDGPKTPRKLRLYGRHALSWLIDEEDARPVSYYATRRAKHPLLPTPEAVVRHLADAGTRVFCEVDHGKGFLLDGDAEDFPASELRQVVRGLGVPVIADPRPSRNWPYIRGDKVILKMNHDQLNAVVGRPAGFEWAIPAGDFYESDQRRHFAAVRAEIAAGRLIHCDYLWLTYGGGGMSIGPLTGDWSAHLPASLGESIPVEAIRIDPTGCGDTCTAIMAHTIAARGYTAAAVVDGFLYANHAAGLAARHLGCHVMTRPAFEEVKREVAEDRVRLLAHVA